MTLGEQIGGFLQKAKSKLENSGANQLGNEFRENQNAENAQKMINYFYKLGKSWDGAEYYMKTWQTTLAEGDELKNLTLNDLIKIRNKAKEKAKAQVAQQSVQKERNLKAKVDSSIPHLTSLKRKTFRKDITPNVEILNEQLLLIKCTQAEAIKKINNNEVYDENGRRIIYYITDTKPFSMQSSKVFRRKNFIAYHGTGAHNKMSDQEVTKSGLKTLAKSMDAAFMIAHNGAIVQFFDAQQGYGALGNIPYKLGYGDINRHTIAVEIALREDKKGQYGVEEPKLEQIKASIFLTEHLKNTYGIANENVITSADPVKRGNQFVRGAHVDDFSPATRKAMGISSSDMALKRLIAFGESEFDQV